MRLLATRAIIGILLALIAIGADARTRLKKPRRGFQMRVGTYTIAPAADVEMCEYRRLPIKKPMDVTSFTLRMPPGAHHFAMWGYGGALTDDSRFRQGPFESIGCTGAAPDDPFPQLMIPTQSPNTTLRFPKGIALRLEPHQQVFLNPHMKNFGSESIAPDIRFNFVRARGKVEHYAEGLTFGNMLDIHIPAGGEQTLTAEWTTPVNLTIIHLATHQHRLGTYANIELVSADGASREQLVESFDWEHPSSVWPPGGIRLEKGRKLRVTCRWHNTTDRDVAFGPETTDEMCFAIGFYYRDPGDTAPPVGGGCFSARKGLLCPLAPTVTD
jgi:hypothetical protein